MVGKKGEIGGILVFPATPDDWEPAMDLCWRTFLKFEAPIYQREGIMSFLEFISDGQLHHMFLNGDYKIWVAKRGSEIVGVGSLRAGNHISLLFVDEKYHRHGIGKLLVQRMQDALPKKFGVRMTVNASPYGEAFYHKLGFKDCDEQQRTDGIIYTPMVLLKRVKR